MGSLAAVTAATCTDVGPTTTERQETRRESREQEREKSFGE